jgi:hypothetical protein
MGRFEFPLRAKLNVFTRALFHSPLYFKIMLHKLRFAGKDIRLKVNAEKTKYLVTFGERKAGQNTNIKTVNKPFERVEQLKHQETNLTDQIQFRKRLRTD